MTLSDYLLAELRRLADRPSPQQFWQRLRSREPVEPSVSSVEAIRQEREARDSK